LNYPATTKNKRREYQTRDALSIRGCRYLADTGNQSYGYGTHTGCVSDRNTHNTQHSWWPRRPSSALTQHCSADHGCSVVVVTATCATRRVGVEFTVVPLLQFRPALMIRLNLDTLYIFFFSVVNIMLALQESVTRVGSSNGISVQISQDINNFFFDKERLQRKPHNYRFY
jgi:hypothetical protein